MNELEPSENLKPYLPFGPSPFEWPGTPEPDVTIIPGNGLDEEPFGDAGTALPILPPEGRLYRSAAGGGVPESDDAEQGAPAPEAPATPNPGAGRQDAPQPEAGDASQEQPAEGSSAGAETQAAAETQTEQEQVALALGALTGRLSGFAEHEKTHMPYRSASVSATLSVDRPLTGDEFKQVVLGRDADHFEMEITQTAATENGTTFSIRVPARGWYEGSGQPEDGRVTINRVAERILRLMDDPSQAGTMREERPFGIEID